VLQFALIAFIGFFFYRDGAALARALPQRPRPRRRRVAGRLLEIVGGTINGVMVASSHRARAGPAAVMGFLNRRRSRRADAGFITASFDRSGGTAADMDRRHDLAVLPGPSPAGPCSWRLGVLHRERIDNVVKPLLISRGSASLVLVLLGVLGGVLAFGFVATSSAPTLLAVGFRFVRRWARRKAEPTRPPRKK